MEWPSHPIRSFVSCQWPLRIFWNGTIVGVARTFDMARQFQTAQFGSFFSFVSLANSFGKMLLGVYWWPNTPRCTLRSHVSSTYVDRFTKIPGLAKAHDLLTDHRSTADYRWFVIKQVSVHGPRFRLPETAWPPFPLTFFCLPFLLDFSLFFFLSSCHLLLSDFFFLVRTAQTRARVCRRVNYGRLAGSLWLP